MRKIIKIIIIKRKKNNLKDFKNFFFFLNMFKCYFQLNKFDKKFFGKEKKKKKKINNIFR